MVFFSKTQSNIIGRESFVRMATEASVPKTKLTAGGRLKIIVCTPCLHANAIPSVTANKRDCNNKKEKGLIVLEMSLNFLQRFKCGEFKYRRDKDT